MIFIFIFSRIFLTMWAVWTLASSCMNIFLSPTNSNKKTLYTFFITLEETPSLGVSESPFNDSKPLCILSPKTAQNICLTLFPHFVVWTSLWASCSPGWWNVHIEAISSPCSTVHSSDHLTLPQSEAWKCLYWWPHSRCWEAWWGCISECLHCLHFCRPIWCRSLWRAWTLIALSTLTRRSCWVVWGFSSIWL